MGRLHSILKQRSRIFSAISFNDLTSISLVLILGASIYVNHKICACAFSLQLIGIYLGLPKILTNDKGFVQMHLQ